MSGRTPRKALLKPLRQRNGRTISTSTRCQFMIHGYFHPIQASNVLRQRSTLRPSICRSFKTFSTQQNFTDKFRDTVRKARNENRILFPALLIATFASLCFLALLAYDEYTGEEESNPAFSAAVNRHLRSAIWFTEINPAPNIAADSFTSALEQAEREGMDPVSPEVAGIHTRFAAALEKFGKAKGAVEVLDRLADDLAERIEDMDLGRSPQWRIEKTGPSPGKDDTSPAVSTKEPSSRTGEAERARLLKQLIECKHKISDLYRSDYIQDEVSAHRSMENAMRLFIESMPDPRSLQFDQNRATISVHEAARLLSNAGDSHLTQRNYGTALEIYKLALIATRKGSQGLASCSEAFILSSMQATVHRMLASSNPVIDGKPATESSAKQARQISGGWAKQSLQCAQAAVERGQQDDLCAKAVMSSWSGLASTLVELGDLKGARAMWDQVIHNSQSQESLQGLIPLAETALKDLDEKEKRTEAV